MDYTYIKVSAIQRKLKQAQTKKLMEAYNLTITDEKAMSLIERLELYFEAHRRTYNKIENGLLRAIVQYRMKLGDWQKSLGTALQTAQAAVLRALAWQPQSLATVSALLWARDGPLPAETETALATASFILDFGEYFSTGGG